MKDFRNGVSYYTHGTVSIGFPEGDVVCHWCPLLGMEYKQNRAYCRKTGEYIPAPDNDIGLHCPIIIEAEKEV